MTPSELVEYRQATGSGVPLLEDDIVLSAWKHAGVHLRTSDELASIIEYKRKEETLHNLGNSALFREFISENPDIWDDELKFDIYESAREIVSYEKALVEYLDPPHMTKDDLNRYIEYCADNALKELGMKPNWDTTSNPLPYMDDVVGAIQADFFSSRVTEYTKQLEGTWDQVSYDKWR